MGFPSDRVGWAPGGWFPSGYGRIGTKGVAPKWMRQDRHQGGGAQVDVLWFIRFVLSKLV